MFHNKNNKEKGVSLYISFMIMTALLGIAMGAGALLFSQLDMLRGIGHSVFAFYATDAGVERALYINNTTCLEAQDPVDCLNAEFVLLTLQDRTLSNGAVYEFNAEVSGAGSCPAGYSHCVRVVGSYQESQRAVRVAR